MDPFDKLPRELHENFLQHFSAVEVFDVLPFVSKSWYKEVANSNTCMKKLSLNLRSRRTNYFSERIETLRWMSRKDGRKYQHLQLNCLLDERISFEVWNFLNSVSKCVETINIRSMKLDEELKPISLPKLEELKMMFIPREPMNHLLTSSSCLKKLILRNEFSLCYDGIDYSPSEETVNAIKESFKRNKKLEDMEMQGRPHFISLFHQDLSEFVNFRLKKLVVKIEMSAEKILEEHLENFLKFLTLQAPNLKHLYIDSCGARVTKHAFNNMPELNFLRFDIELREPNKFVIKDLELTPNEKITQFELPYIAQIDDVTDFLELVPNVEEILIGHLTPRLIEFAGKTLKKLKSIVFRYDDCFGGGNEVYKNLKHENPNINKNIKMTICNDFL